MKEDSKISSTIKVGQTVKINYGWKKPYGIKQLRRASVVEILPFNKIKVSFYDFDKIDIVEMSDVNLFQKEDNNDYDKKSYDLKFAYIFDI